jgi:hypothetical protein
VLAGPADARMLAIPILAALALGSLLGSGAIRIVADARFLRRALQRPILRRFFAESEAGHDAWRELLVLAAESGPRELLARSPEALAAALKGAATVVFATPSRYEALVRMLGHGAEKNDLDIVLGHELAASGLRPTTEDHFRAELRFRESRDRLRARAARRVERVEEALERRRARVAATAALAVAPWPALALVGVAGPSSALLCVATALAAASLAVRVARTR